MQTQDALLRHHRGAEFHDVMVQSFQGRFGAPFWARWATEVAAHHSGQAPTYLDLGCGPGLLLGAWRERFPEAQLHAVELMPYMLQSARASARDAGATLHEQDLHTLALELPDASVDGAICAMVVHEMREPFGLFNEVRRLLRPSGRLVLIDWIRIPLESYLARLEARDLPDQKDATIRGDRLEHFMEHNKYTADDLRWLLESCGLEVESCELQGDGQFARLVVRRRGGE